MAVSPNPLTYEGQLAQRVEELLPGMDNAERLRLLGVMDEADLRSSLAWLVSYAPQVFDYALVRDQAMTERLVGRVDAREEAEYLAEPEGYCTVCGANVSWFIGYEGAAALPRPAQARHRQRAPRAVRRRARAGGRVARGRYPVSAELSARRTAAAAALGDFKRETDKYIDTSGTVPRPDMGMWAWRLSSELASVLQRLEAEAAEAAPDSAAAQLAEVRLVLDAFDWEADDRQYALEKIEGIVNRSRT
jgi:hypothetical protein